MKLSSIASLSAFLANIIFLCASASADCFTDCMSAADCWIAGGNSDAAYCSGTEARCETDCRHQSKPFGAIAYSAKDGAFGYSDGWDSQAQAEKTAVKFCSQNGKGCESMVWFQNSCGAVAADGSTAAWGQDDSEARAKQKALSACAKAGGKKCEVVVSHCS